MSKNARHPALEAVRYFDEMTRVGRISVTGHVNVLHRAFRLMEAALEAAPKYTERADQDRRAAIAFRRLAGMMARVYGEDGMDMAPEFIGRAMNYAMGIMLGLDEWAPPKGGEWTPEEEEIIAVGLRAAPADEERALSDEATALAAADPRYDADRVMAAMRAAWERPTPSDAEEAEPVAWMVEVRTTADGPWHSLSLRSERPAAYPPYPTPFHNGELIREWRVVPLCRAPVADEAAR